MLIRMLIALGPIFFSSWCLVWHNFQSSFDSRFKFIILHSAHELTSATKQYTVQSWHVSECEGLLKNFKRLSEIAAANKTSLIESGLNSDGYYRLVSLLDTVTESRTNWAACAVMHSTLQSFALFWLLPIFFVGRWTFFTWRFQCVMCKRWCW